MESLRDAVSRLLLVVSQPNTEKKGKPREWGGGLVRIEVDVGG